MVVQRWKNLSVSVAPKPNFVDRTQFFANHVIIAMPRMLCCFMADSRRKQVARVRGFV